MNRKLLLICVYICYTRFVFRQYDCYISGLPWAISLKLQFCIPVIVIARTLLQSITGRQVPRVSRRHHGDIMQYHWHPGEVHVLRAIRIFAHVENTQQAETHIVHRGFSSSFTQTQTQTHTHTCSECNKNEERYPPLRSAQGTYITVPGSVWVRGRAATFVVYSVYRTGVPYSDSWSSRVHLRRATQPVPCAAPRVSF